MRPSSWIEIDLTAVESNVAALRRACGLPGRGGAAICAVLKADGYALGSVELARTVEAAGVEMVAVYTTADARPMLAAGIGAPILVLGPMWLDDLAGDPIVADAAKRGRLHLTAHSLEQTASLETWARDRGARLPVHVEVDTGMSRGGASLEDAEVIVRFVAQSERLALAGVMTHFASADRDAAFTREQSARFGAWIDRVRAHMPSGCVAHQANTMGSFRGEGMHRDMIRVGLALLGYASEEMRDPGGFALLGHARDLRPAVRWMTRVIHESRIPVGATAGYGGLWRAERPSRLGLAPVGYADGYPLSLSGKGSVRVALGEGRWQEAPIVGAVSMDQVTIDLTDLPAHIGADAEVEVYGAEPTASNYLPTLARRAGSITHESLCRLAPRLERRYVRSRSAPETAPIVMPERSRAERPASSREAV